MLISCYANKKSSPRLPSWQPSSIFFNIPIGSGSTIKPCTLKHFQVTCILHKAGYWTMRDLIAATGLVILLNLDSNRRFFSPCDLEIWWMTKKNNGAPLLYYIKLCASFQIHRWTQTRVTVRKHSIPVKIGIFCPVWPWNLMDDLEKL